MSLHVRFTCKLMDNKSKWCFLVSINLTWCQFFALIKKSYKILNYELMKHHLQKRWEQTRVAALGASEWTTTMVKHCLLKRQEDMQVETWHRLIDNKNDWIWSAKTTRANVRHIARRHQSTSTMTMFCALEQQDEAQVAVWGVNQLTMMTKYFLQK